MDAIAIRRPLTRGNRSRFRVTLVGLGNIGSALIELIVRLPGLVKLTLIDLDAYEEKNLAAQQIDRADLGKAKVEVQAARARRAAPGIEVLPVPWDVANVPPGWMRGNLIIGAVDNLAARAALQRHAWRLGIPCLDAGVDPESGLVRITGIRPGPEAPCFECAFGETEYDRMASAAMPCQRGDGGGGGSTDGDPALGALAASLTAFAAAQIAADPAAWSFHGNQLIYDSRGHNAFTTRLIRRNDCGFDHRTWELAPLPPLPDTATLGDFLEVLAGSDTRSIELAGCAVVRHAGCPRCGMRVDGWHVAGRLCSSANICARCGGLVSSIYFDGAENLFDLPHSARRLELRQLGIGPGDVARVTCPAGDRFFEYTAPESARVSRGWREASAGDR